jgi:hypothetical protein
VDVRKIVTALSRRNYSQHNPAIILSGLVQYWTATYSNLTDDADPPFAAANDTSDVTIRRHTSKASEQGYELKKGKYEK